VLLEDVADPEPGDAGRRRRALSSKAHILVGNVKLAFQIEMFPVQSTVQLHIIISSPNRRIHSGPKNFGSLIFGTTKTTSSFMSLPAVRKGVEGYANHLHGSV
jgi:hypothetical protein